MPLRETEVRVDGEENQRETKHEIESHKIGEAGEHKETPKEGEQGKKEGGEGASSSDFALQGGDAHKKGPLHTTGFSAPPTLL